MDVIVTQLERQYNQYESHNRQIDTDDIVAQNLSDSEPHASQSQRNICLRGFFVLCNTSQMMMMMMMMISAIDC